jgi:hypothetical protein
MSIFTFTFICNRNKTPLKPSDFNKIFGEKTTISTDPNRNLLINEKNSTGTTSFNDNYNENNSTNPTICIHRA